MGGIGRRQEGGGKPTTQGGQGPQQPDRHLLLKYLADQAQQRERDLAEADERVASGAAAVDGELEALNEGEEWEGEGEEAEAGGGGGGAAGDAGDDDVAFLEGRFAGETVTRQATAATRRQATAVTGVTIATAATAATASKDFAAGDGSRAVSAWAAAPAATPNFPGHEREAGPCAVPSTLKASADAAAAAAAGASPTPSGRSARSGGSEAAKTPLSQALSNRSTGSLQEDAHQLRARLDQLKRDLSKATALTDATPAAAARPERPLGAATA